MKEYLENKKILHITVFVLLLLLTMMLCSCGKSTSPETEVETVEELSDEQALSAIRNYCYSMNPELKSIVNAGEYPVYWEVSSSDEQEIVVLFRSYTGAQKRYYIDRITGDTYVTEFVPEIFTEEQKTDESLNVRDYCTQ